jgi:hypothetical protein
VDFLIVYVREAHAMDSHLPMTFGAVEDPVTMDERHAMAAFSSKELGLTMPAVVDELDDHVSLAYSAWPERLYLVGPAGKVLFRCGPGPFGFDPDGLGSAIEDHLATAARR